MKGFQQKITMIRYLKSILKIKLTLVVYNRARMEAWRQPEYYSSAAGDDTI